MAATTLQGWDWVGDSEPSVGVQATQGWRQPTSGNWWVRNTSNTDWTYMGNMNDNALGSVQTAGDTMSGPLNSVPNLLPTTDPDASGTIRENGFPLATELSLSQLQQFIMTQLKSMVRAQFLSQTKLSGTAANVAFGSGYVALTYAEISSGNTYSIPYPVFQSDNIQATRGQILAYGWSLVVFSPGLDTNHMGLVETATGSMVLEATGDWGLDATTVGIQYWAFAVR